MLRNLDLKVSLTADARSVREEVESQLDGVAFEALAEVSQTEFQAQIDQLNGQSVMVDLDATESLQAIRDELEQPISALLEIDDSAARETLDDLQDSIQEASVQLEIEFNAEEAGRRLGNVARELIGGTPLKLELNPFKDAGKSFIDGLAETLDTDIKLNTGGIISLLFGSVLRGALTAGGFALATAFRDRLAQGDIQIPFLDSLQGQIDKAFDSVLGRETSDKVEENLSEPINRTTKRFNRELLAAAERVASLLDEVSTQFNAGQFRFDLDLARTTATEIADELERAADSFASARTGTPVGDGQQGVRTSLESPTSGQTATVVDTGVDTSGLQAQFDAVESPTEELAQLRQDIGSFGEIFNNLTSLSGSLGLAFEGFTRRLASFTLPQIDAASFAGIPDGDGLNQQLSNLLRGVGAAAQELQSANFATDNAGLQSAVNGLQSEVQAASGSLVQLESGITGSGVPPALRNLAETIQARTQQIAQLAADAPPETRPAFDALLSALRNTSENLLQTAPDGTVVQRGLDDTAKAIQDKADAIARIRIEAPDGSSTEAALLELEQSLRDSAQRLRNTQAPELPDLAPQFNALGDQVLAATNRFAQLPAPTLPNLRPAFEAVEADIRGAGDQIATIDFPQPPDLGPAFAQLEQEVRETSGRIGSIPTPDLSSITVTAQDVARSLSGVATDIAGLSFPDGSELGEQLNRSLNVVSSAVSDAAARINSIEAGELPDLSPPLNLLSQAVLETAAKIESVDFPVELAPQAQAVIAGLKNAETQLGAIAFPGSVTSLDPQLDQTRNELLGLSGALQETVNRIGQIEIPEVPDITIELPDLAPNVNSAGEAISAFAESLRSTEVPLIDIDDLQERLNALARNVQLFSQDFSNTELIPPDPVRVVELASEVDRALQILSGIEAPDLKPQLEALQAQLQTAAQALTVEAPPDISAEFTALQRNLSQAAADINNIDIQNPSAINNGIEEIEASLREAAQRIAGIEILAPDLAPQLQELSESLTRASVNISAVEVPDVTQQFNVLQRTLTDAAAQISQIEVTEPDLTDELGDLRRSLTEAATAIRSTDLQDVSAINSSLAAVDTTLREAAGRIETLTVTAPDISPQLESLTTSLVRAASNIESVETPDIAPQFNNLQDALTSAIAKLGQIEVPETPELTIELPDLAPQVNEAGLAITAFSEKLRSVEVPEVGGETLEQELTELARKVQDFGARLANTELVPPDPIRLTELANEVDKAIRSLGEVEAPSLRPQLEELRNQLLAGAAALTVEAPPSLVSEFTTLQRNLTDISSAIGSLDIRDTAALNGELTALESSLKEAAGRINQLSIEAPDLAPQLLGLTESLTATATEIRAVTPPDLNAQFNDLQQTLANAIVKLGQVEIPVAPDLTIELPDLSPQVNEAGQAIARFAEELGGQDLVTDELQSQLTILATNVQSTAQRLANVELLPPDPVRLTELANEVEKAIQSLGEIEAPDLQDQLENLRTQLRTAAQILAVEAPPDISAEFTALQRNLSQAAADINNIDINGAGLNTSLGVIEESLREAAGRIESITVTAPDLAPQFEGLTASLSQATTQIREIQPPDLQVQFGDLQSAIQAAIARFGEIQVPDAPDLNTDLPDLAPELRKIIGDLQSFSAQVDEFALDAPDLEPLIKSVKGIARRIENVKLEAPDPSKLTALATEAERVAQRFRDVAAPDLPDITPDLQQLSRALQDGATALTPEIPDVTPQLTSLQRNLGDAAQAIANLNFGAPDGVAIATEALRKSLASAAQDFADIQVEAPSLGLDELGIAINGAVQLIERTTEAPRLQYNLNALQTQLLRSTDALSGISERLGMVAIPELPDIQDEATSLKSNLSDLSTRIAAVVETPVTPAAIESVTVATDEVVTAEIPNLESPLAALVVAVEKVTGELNESDAEGLQQLLREFGEAAAETGRITEKIAAIEIPEIPAIELAETQESLADLSQAVRSVAGQIEEGFTANSPEAFEQQSRALSDALGVAIKALNNVEAPSIAVPLANLTEEFVSAQARIAQIEPPDLTPPFKSVADALQVTANNILDIDFALPPNLTAEFNALVSALEESAAKINAVETPDFAAVEQELQSLAPSIKAAVEEIESTEAPDLGGVFEQVAAALSGPIERLNELQAAIPETILPEPVAVVEPAPETVTPPTAAPTEAQVERAEDAPAITTLDRLAEVTRIAAEQLAKIDATPAQAAIDDLTRSAVEFTASNLPGAVEFLSEKIRAFTATDFKTSDVVEELVQAAQKIQDIDFALPPSLTSELNVLVAALDDAAGRIHAVDAPDFENVQLQLNDIAPAIRTAIRAIEETDAPNLDSVADAFTDALAVPLRRLHELGIDAPEAPPEELSQLDRVLAGLKVAAENAAEQLKQVDTSTAQTSFAGLDALVKQFVDSNLPVAAAAAAEKLGELVGLDLEINPEDLKAGIADTAESLRVFTGDVTDLTSRGLKTAAEGLQVGAEALGKVPGQVDEFRAKFAEARDTASLTTQAVFDQLRPLGDAFTDASTFAVESGESLRKLASDLPPLSEQIAPATNLFRDLKGRTEALSNTFRDAVDSVRPSANQVPDNVTQALEVATSEINDTGILRLFGRFEELERRAGRVVAQLDAVLALDLQEAVRRTQQATDEEPSTSGPLASTPELLSELDRKLQALTGTANALVDINLASVAFQASESLKGIPNIGDDVARLGGEAATAAGHLKGFADNNLGSTAANVAESLQKLSGIDIGAINIDASGTQQQLIDLEKQIGIVSGRLQNVPLDSLEGLSNVANSVGPLSKALVELLDPSTRIGDAFNTLDDSVAFLLKEFGRLAGPLNFFQSIAQFFQDQEAQTRALASLSEKIPELTSQIPNVNTVFERLAVVGANLGKSFTGLLGRLNPFNNGSADSEPRPGEPLPDLESDPQPILIDPNGEEINATPPSTSGSGSTDLEDIDDSVFDDVIDNLRGQQEAAISAFQEKFRTQEDPGNAADVTAAAQSIRDSFFDSVVDSFSREGLTELLSDSGGFLKGVKFNLTPELRNALKKKRDELGSLTAVEVDALREAVTDAVVSTDSKNNFVQGTVRDIRAREENTNLLVPGSFEGGLERPGFVDDERRADISRFAEFGVLNASAASGKIIGDLENAAVSGDNEAVKQVQLEAESVSKSLDFVREAVEQFTNDTVIEGGDASVFDADLEKIRQQKQAIEELIGVARAVQGDADGLTDLRELTKQIGAAAEAGDLVANSMRNILAEALPEIAETSTAIGRGVIREILGNLNRALPGEIVQRPGADPRTAQPALTGFDDTIDADFTDIPIPDRSALVDDPNSRRNALRDILINRDTTANLAQVNKPGLEKIVDDQITKISFDDINPEDLEAITKRRAGATANELRKLALDLSELLEGGIEETLGQVLDLPEADLAKALRDRISKAVLAGPSANDVVFGDFGSVIQDVEKIRTQIKGLQTELKVLTEQGLEEAARETAAEIIQRTEGLRTVVQQTLDRRSFEDVEGGRNQFRGILGGIDAQQVNARTVLDGQETEGISRDRLIQQQSTIERFGGVGGAPLNNEKLREFLDDGDAEAIARDSGGEVGDAYAIGVRAGIQARITQLEDSADEMGMALIKQLREVLDIRSPSGVGRLIGLLFDQGVEVGIEGGLPKVLNAATNLGAGMVQQLVKEAAASGVPTREFIENAIAELHRGAEEAGVPARQFVKNFVRDFEVEGVDLPPAVRKLLNDAAAAAQRESRTQGSAVAKVIGRLFADDIEVGLLDGTEQVAAAAGSLGDAILDQFVTEAQAAGQPVKEFIDSVIVELHAGAQRAGVPAREYVKEFVENFRVEGASLSEAAASVLDQQSGNARQARPGGELNTAFSQGERLGSEAAEAANKAFNIGEKGAERAKSAFGRLDKAIREPIDSLRDLGRGFKRGFETGAEGLGSLQERFPVIGKLTTGFKQLAVAGLAAFGLFQLEDILVDLGRAAFQTTARMQALEATLAFSSAGDGSTEIAFVNGEVDRLRLNLESSIETFTQLNNAAKGTILEGQGVRDIFSGLSQAIRVFNKSGDEQQRIIAQISQGINKQQVELEDLKTISEGGIPIFQAFQNALNLDGQEFRKLLSDGKIGLNELSLAVNELENLTADGLEGSLNTVNAQVARLQTNFTRALVAIGEAIEPISTRVLAALNVTIEFLVVEGAKAQEIFNTIFMFIKAGFDGLADAVSPFVKALEFVVGSARKVVAQFRRFKVVADTVDGITNRFRELTEGTSILSAVVTGLVVFIVASTIPALISLAGIISGVVTSAIASMTAAGIAFTVTPIGAAIAVIAAAAVLATPTLKNFAEELAGITAAQKDRNAASEVAAEADRERLATEEELASGIAVSTSELNRHKEALQAQVSAGITSSSVAETLSNRLDRLQLAAQIAAAAAAALTAEIKATSEAFKEQSEEIETRHLQNQLALAEANANNQVTQEQSRLIELGNEQQHTRDLVDLYANRSDEISEQLDKLRSTIASGILRGEQLKEAEKQLEELGKQELDFGNRSIKAQTDFAKNRVKIAVEEEKQLQEQLKAVADERAKIAKEIENNAQIAIQEGINQRTVSEEEAGLLRAQNAKARAEEEIELELQKIADIEALEPTNNADTEEARFKQIEAAQSKLSELTLTSLRAEQDEREALTAIISLQYEELERQVNEAQQIIELQETNRQAEIQGLVNQRVLTEEQANEQIVSSDRERIQQQLKIEQEKQEILRSLDTNDDPELAERQQEQIRDSLQQTASLQLELLNNEREGQEALKDLILKRLDDEDTLREIEAGKREQVLNRRIELENAVTKTLERQQSIESAANGLANAQLSLRRRLLEIQQERDPSERTQEKINELVRQELLEKQRIERLEKQREIEREASALRVAAVEARIAEVRATQAVAEAQNNVARAVQEGDPVQIANAQANLEIQRQALGLTQDLTDETLRQQESQEERGELQKEELLVRQELERINLAFSQNPDEEPEDFGVNNREATDRRERERREREERRRRERSSEDPAFERDNRDFGRSGRREAEAEEGRRDREREQRSVEPQRVLDTGSQDRFLEKLANERGVELLPSPAAESPVQIGQAIGEAINLTEGAEPINLTEGVQEMNMAPLGLEMTSGLAGIQTMLSTVISTMNAANNLNVLAEINKQQSLSAGYLNQINTRGANFKNNPPAPPTAAPSVNPFELIGL